MYMNCPICGKLLLDVTPAHAKMHGMTVKEMTDKYPELRKCQSKFFPNKQNKARADKRFGRYRNEHK